MEIGEWMKINVKSIKAMNTKSPNSNHMAIKSCEMEK
jgi:hypothetical protein